MNVPTIIVTGQKGGTGKSTLAANIAVRLSEKGQVGVLDADIDSPNLPDLLGISKVMELDELQNFIPVEVNPQLRIFSMRLFHDPETQHGFSKSGDQNEQIIHDAINYCNWGYLDYFIVDLPAGSSDEFRAVLKRLDNILGMIVVTLPSTISDLERVVDLAGRFRKHILGVVENFTEVVCGNCSHHIPLFGPAGNTRVAQVCEERSIKYLGGIPYVPEMHQEGGSKFQLPEGSAQLIDKLVEVIDAKWSLGETENRHSHRESDEATV